MAERLRHICALYLFWFETERSTVQFPASALPSNNSGQVVHTYRVQQNSSLLKFFAVFSATVWNFNLKFYSIIY